MKVAAQRAHRRSSARDRWRWRDSRNSGMSRATSSLWFLKNEQVIETELETAPPHESQPRRLKDPRRPIRGESVVLLEGHTVDEAQGAQGIQNTIDPRRRDRDDHVAPALHVCGNVTRQFRLVTRRHMLEHGEEGDHIERSVFVQMFRKRARHEPVRRPLDAPLESWIDPDACREPAPMVPEQTAIGAADVQDSRPFMKVRANLRFPPSSEDAVDDGHRFEPGASRRFMPRMLRKK